jgi:peptidase E
LLAVWREHGVDIALRRAWEAGAVLAGLSAGAMCWFEGGVTMSGGAPAVVAGLGLLTGSLSVHLDGEPGRWPVYREAVATGALPSGHAVDDNAALVFEGEQLTACVASRAGARVISVSADEAGRVIERPLTVRVLPGVGDGGVTRDADAISELRELRAGRHRWE